MQSRSPLDVLASSVQDTCPWPGDKLTGSRGSGQRVHTEALWRAWARACARLARHCVSLVQRRPVLTGLLACALTPAALAATCPPPRLTLARLSPTLLQVVAAEGESDAANRGLTSNLLVLREGRRVWLIGSGPSPAAGRALACQLRQLTGWTVTDLVAPWPRPELVLGAAAFPKARRWAHAEVADAMAERCPRCVERMRLRLGPRAGDLDPDPIRPAQLRFTGRQGSLGPLRWWRLMRSPETAVTVFRLRDQPLWMAPGLLWAEGPPDLRDASLETLEGAWTTLAQLAQDDGSAARWLPEQGPWLGADAPALHLRYGAWLRQAVQAAQARGALETDAPEPGADLPAWQLREPRQGLNWQRAWRLLEEAGFEAVPPR